MKKEELKKMLKPIVKECIKESLYESGLLSSIIAEVVQGVVAGNQAVITEANASERAPAPAPVRTNENKRSEQAARRKQAELRETKKNLLDSIGKGAYNGVDLFEGTTPLKSGGKPSGGATGQGPFSGVDPSDPGVNIDSLTEQLGGVWKKLAEGGKK
tara:strand:- start:565 stop:1038 length:474 start_codon:yes stop_codon:yes gene_type:complete